MKKVSFRAVDDTGRIKAGDISMFRSIIELLTKQTGLVYFNKSQAYLQLLTGLMKADGSMPLSLLNKYGRGNSGLKNKFSYSGYIFTFAADKTKMITNTHIHHHHFTHGVGCDGSM